MIAPTGSTTILRPVSAFGKVMPRKGEFAIRAGFAPKQKGDLIQVASRTNCKWLLDPFDVLGLPAFWPFDYVELDLLTFLKAAESTGLNGREVYEHVLAVLAADKSITFGVVKPLYCSCFHTVAVFLCVEIALNFRWTSATGRSRRRTLEARFGPWGGKAGVANCQSTAKSNASIL